MALQRWQARSFVLYPSVLVYSRSMGTALLGALPMLSIFWFVKHDDARLDISFEAEDGTGLGEERVMQLRMQSDAERDAWRAHLAQQHTIVRHDHSSATHSREFSEDELQADTHPFVPRVTADKAHQLTPYVRPRTASIPPV